MTDTVRQTPSIRQLPLAPGGELVISLTSNDLRIRGTDADSVTIRTRGGEDIDDELVIEADGDRVFVRTAERGFRIGRALIASRGPADLEIEVPRSVRFTCKTLSGDVEADGIGRDSRWSSASGQLRVRGARGTLTADSMSGDVTIEADDSIGVRARTVSGDLRVRAPHLDALELASTSGDIRIAGPLGTAFEHTISSVSGDVHLQSPSPIRLESQTIAGDIRATGAHRAEGGRGRRTIIVGDGSVRVGVRTTSGDIRLEAAATADVPRPNAPIPPIPSVRPPDPPAAPSAAVPPVPGAPEPWVVAEAAAAPNLVRRPLAEDTTSNAIDAEGADDRAPAEPHVGGAESAVDRREQARLDILRALERGDLDVAAASHRLEQLDEAGPRYFRGFC
jgi:hypothetical protein